MDYLKHIDIYSQSIPFNIENDNKFKANFGGFLGFLLGCIFLSLFIVFGLDCFQRINPSIILQKLSLQESQKFTLKKENFQLKFLFLSFGIDGKPTPVSTIYFEMNYIIIDSNRTYLNTSNFIKGTNDNYSFYMDVVNDIVVSDFFLDSKFSFINFQINLCKDSAICNRTAVDEYLLYNTVLGVVFFNRSVVDITNKQKPLSTNLDYLVFNLNPSISKNIFMTFKNVSVYNDLDFLFQSPSYSTSLDVDSILDDAGISPSGLQNLTNTTTLLNGFLKFGRNKDVYQISYPKIQSVFATVGGIVNVFNLIFAVCASVYGKININNYLVNSIYTYRNFESDNKIKIGSNYRNEVESTIIPSPDLIQRFSSTSVNFQSKLVSNASDESGRLTFSFILNIKQILCPCMLRHEEKRKIKIFNEVLEILNRKLDIGEYFKFHERFLESLKIIYQGNTSRINTFEGLFKKKINFFYSSYLNTESKRFQQNRIEKLKIRSSLQKRSKPKKANIMSE